MNMDEIKAVYFVGAGGIGMSALIRYFLFNNNPTLTKYYKQRIYLFCILVKLQLYYQIDSY